MCSSSIEGSVSSNVDGPSEVSSVAVESDVPEGAIVSEIPVVSVVPHISLVAETKMNGSVISLVPSDVSAISTVGSSLVSSSVGRSASTSIAGSGSISLGHGLVLG